MADGSKIRRWALISFGNYPDQHSSISRFISQFSVRCHQLGIFLSRTTAAPPVFEPLQTLSSAATLESKLRQLHSAVDLELLICVMEKKHRGYIDLKRIAETEIGVITQCCLSSNISKPSSQFVSNLSNQEYFIYRLIRSNRPKHGILPVMTRMIVVLGIKSSHFYSR